MKTKWLAVSMLKKKIISFILGSIVMSGCTQHSVVKRDVMIDHSVQLGILRDVTQPLKEREKALWEIINRLQSNDVGTIDALYDFLVDNPLFPKEVAVDNSDVPKEMIRSSVKDAEVTTVEVLIGSKGKITITRIYGSKGIKRRKIEITQ